MYSHIQDCSKAFHMVAHIRLIHKTNHCGIGSQLLSWIENWLAHSTQAAVIGGEVYHLMPLKEQSLVS